MQACTHTHLFFEGMDAPCLQRCGDCDRYMWPPVHVPRDTPGEGHDVYNVDGVDWPDLKVVARALLPRGPSPRDRVVVLSSSSDLMSGFVIESAIESAL